MGARLNAIKLKVVELYVVILSWVWNTVVGYEPSSVRLIRLEEAILRASAADRRRIITETDPSHSSNATTIATVIGRRNTKLTNPYGLPYNGGATIRSIRRDM